MILISHRGNTNGPMPAIENNPNQIMKVLNSGYDVEIDVWYIDQKWYLGHDKADYKIEEDFLEQPGLWCHAKNLQAASKMSLNKKIHWFWHENDKITITSKGFIWAHPGFQPLSESIAVMPETLKETVSHAIGVCSDYIEEYKNGKQT